MKVAFVMDFKAGGALEICFRYLERALARIPGISCQFVDVRQFETPKADVIHFAAWYLYRDKSFEVDPYQCVITVHHLTRWNDYVASVARDGVRLVTMSTEWFDELKRQGVSTHNLAIVPHGISPDDWTANRRWGSTSQKKRIGLIGRVYPDGRKGERLVPIIAKGLQASDVEFVVIGTDWEPTIEQMQTAGARVELHRSMPFDQLRATVQSLNLLLCTSDIEGGPLPVLEAIASGVPVVSTPVGIARDVLPGWRLGRVFPKGCAEVAIVQIRHVLGRSNDWFSFEQARLVCDMFAWSHVATGYRAIYQAMIAGSAIPLDPNGYLPWLSQRATSNSLVEKVALTCNPRPTDRWSQPFWWRGANKLARHLFRNRV